jgi:hypothetical protein
MAFLVTFSRTNSSTAVAASAATEVVELFPFGGVWLVSVLILGKD